jgi:uncharacterized protein (DUF362 family)
MAKSKVYLTRLNDDDMETSLRSALEAFNWKSIIKPGAKVTIKVNATHFEYLPGLTTTPELVYHYVNILRDRASEVIVGDSDLQRVDGDLALKGCGIKEWGEKAGATVLNFSKDKMVEVDVKGEFFKKTKLPRCYVDCDVFSSMPLFKTHKLTTVTLTLKNHFGCVPDDHRFKYHKVIHKVLADMTAFLDPKLIVMDGRIGLESDGPIAGLPKKLGLILLGNNAVASDSVACRVMGFEPEKVEHIKYAYDRGLGPIEMSKIQLSGLAIKDAYDPFEPAGEDIISKFERLINPHPIWSKMVYKSFLFTTMKKLAWKVRELTGYKRKYEERVKATGLWENYHGLFE